MTIKDKMKTYNFWISLVSAVLLLLRVIGSKYNFEIDSGLVMDVTTGLCGIFVVLGIISAPQKNPAKTAKNTENIQNSAKVSNSNSIIAEIFGGGVAVEDSQIKNISEVDDCLVSIKNETGEAENFIGDSAFCATIEDVVECEKCADCEISPQMNLDDHVSVFTDVSSEEPVAVGAVTNECNNDKDVFCQDEQIDERISTNEVEGCEVLNITNNQEQKLFDVTDYTLLTRDELIALIKSKNA